MAKEIINSLEKSTKAVKSFKELLDNGPLMTILSIQMVAIVLLMSLLINQYQEKSKIQAELYMEMIRRTDEMVESKLEERVTPVVRDAKVAVDKLNDTRESIDTTSQKLLEMINSKRK